MATILIHPPSGQEFLSRFMESFRECVPKGEEERREAWNNWTAFITGKPGRLDGKTAVLPLAAEKLNLRYEHECLCFDLVLFPRGVLWGIFAFIEHENVFSEFANERYMSELEKLMTGLAPLKVGITYDWKATTEAESQLLERIRFYFKTRHPLILEASSTEYLFLLGVGESLNELKWKHLLFTYGEGPGKKRFEDV